MSELDKYYQILGLNPGASEKEIIEAYKVLVKVWNPDRFKDDPQIQKIATQKIKEIDEAFKQLLIWAENRQEKGEEFLDPQVEAKTEPPETRESIDVKADPKQELIVKVGNVFAELRSEKPEPGPVWKDPYMGMEFVFVRGGSYQMGDIYGDGSDDEKPVHEVTVGDFWLGKFPATQGQWEKVMGNNPSHFKSGDNCPVEQVSWNDVQEFIHRLNQKAGKRYRLPTEAEWEYAARSGGKREKWAGTSNASELIEYAWYEGNSNNQTHPVGQKKPNSFVLHDMSGNVNEWVQDWYDKDYYRNSPMNNPCSEHGLNRVIRGGRWNSGVKILRTSSRSCIAPLTSFGTGFRLVLPAQPEQTSIAEMVGLSSLPRKEQPPAPGEKPYDTESSVSQPDSTNLEPKSYVSLRPTVHKDEGRADVQSPPDPGKDVAGSAQSQDKQGPSGIGGWLMLLVIGMMVLGPLFGAGGINAGIMTVERQYPHLVSLDQWITFKSATWWTFLGVAALSFYGGWGLARGKDWSVVNRAKWILWISGPVGSLVMGVLIPIIIVGESNAGDGQFVGAFIAQVIAAGIWTAYLSKSKRVRNTYSG